MRNNRAKLNLFLDIAIGIAFIIEAISGLVLAVVLPHGGYRGGRNPLYAQSFVLTRDEWLSLHDWFAIVMVVGVLIHILLHRKWIACMFRKLWQEAFATKPTAAEAPECPI